jgi:large subunit ribosomal protein L23
MTPNNINKILIKPIITEKTLLKQESGKYSFWITKEANKFQVANAFESLFKIKPIQINIINSKGKIKTNWKTRKPVVKSNRKKAIITVDKKEKVDLLTIKTK